MYGIETLLLLIRRSRKKKQEKGNQMFAGALNYAALHHVVHIHRCLFCGLYVVYCSILQRNSM